MAIVRKLRKPSLFLTMTTNPNWPEIVQELRPGETAQDRPDLVARVFRLKLKQLMQDIKKKEIFGKVIGDIHVVEFQKRGLPHAHILVILTDEDRPRTAEEYDSMVCAEIPDKERNPKLYELVVAHMLHGPCGEANPSCPCMKDGKCSKGYPKAFQEETEERVDGFPRYRRRDNGVTVEK